MTTTARLGLPMIVPGQAQKEVYHNEALQVLDTLVAAAVEGPPQAMPPAQPAVGACFLIGDAPSGAWAGHARAIAAWTVAGWRFTAPRAGMVVQLPGSGGVAVFRNGAWEIGTSVAVRGGSIAAPSGGVTIDAGARSAIDAILAALRQHGLIAA